MKIETTQKNNFLSSLRFAKKNGFALIASIMIMSLLLLVAFAMMSLSNTTVRATSTKGGMDEAKANARMALMMAIGELQQYSGADTRITAPAEIIQAGAPPLTGVWRSWEGTNHDATGRPIQPDYSVKTQRESDGGRFLTWLVSGAQTGQEPMQLNLSPSDLVSSVATPRTIPLLSSGTLGTNPGQVHVVPQVLEDNSGAHAWWVSPENQKARLMHPHSPRTNNELGWADASRTHTLPDPEVFGLGSTVADPESFVPDFNNAKTVRKAISLSTTELLAAANPEAPQESFHDLSTSSIGLLTNTATGGWRKDLSILSERWTNVYTAYPGGMLPLFRFSPTAGATSTSQVPRPTTTLYAPPQSNLYPWSEYFQLGLRRYPMTYPAASASWQSLINFVNSYKSININSSLTLPTASIEWQNQINRTGNTDYYRAYHGTTNLSSLQPVVARYQMIVQANAVPDPRYGPSGNDARYATVNERDYYRVNFRLVPFITLWNPYNIELTRNNVQDIGFGTHRSLPCAISFINGTAPPAGVHTGNYKLINSGNSEGVDRLLEHPNGTNHYYDYQIPENISKGYTPSYITAGLRSLYAWLPRNFSLKPGEVKVFSPGFDMQRQANTLGIRLKEGYEVGDNFGMPLVKASELAGSQNRLINIRTNRPAHAPITGLTTSLLPTNSMLITDTLRIAVKSDRRTKNYSNDYSNQTGAGIFYNLGTSSWGLEVDGGGAGGIYENGNCSKGVQNNRAVMGTSVVEEWAQKYWPSSALEEVIVPVADIVPTSIDPNNPEWTNLLSISFGPRLTFGAGTADPEIRPTKGMLQTNPLAVNTFSIPERQASFHPANGAYDMSYHSMTFNSELSPEVGTAGYIVTGFQSGEGLSRFITSEIPLAPMASLAELQAWNLRGGNPLPPHQYYLIGNSDATPMMPQDGVVIANPALVKNPVDPIGVTTPTYAQILQHDDAYCANHLLFDDWFFSTVMPQPNNFGNTITKNISTVFRDFLEGTDMLTNRAYRTVSEDTKLSPTAVTALVNEIINGYDGWLKVASRLEVDGMFNVNSTSVKAWRALLGHARNQQVAYYSATGIDLDTTVRNHVVSRTTVASDVAAGPATGLGSIFPDGSEYAGFRTLTNAQIDELAEKIVEQIKERGPFLSLSEFVNRQLSLEVGADGKELALAGALQAALDSLTDDPNKALKDAGKQLSSETMDVNDELVVGEKLLDGVGYDFVKASEGYSTHGFPGWIRQADILRPIAPILSARDDTFTIRAYGDYRNENGDVIATAWCEATVQRRRYFVDPSDQADTVDAPVNSQNIQFGRRYDIIKFRWLSADEV